jgi:hypothetical protein
MVGEGYAIFVQGAVKPVAVRVNDFAEIELVGRVINRVKYLSIAIVDDHIIIAHSNGVYGAMVKTSDDTVHHLLEIIAAYPDHTLMDHIYHNPSGGGGWDGGRDGRGVPPIMAIHDIPDDELSSLVPPRVKSHIHQKILIVVSTAMGVLIFGLVVACIALLTLLDTVDDIA